MLTNAPKLVSERTVPLELLARLQRGVERLDLLLVLRAERVADGADGAAALLVVLENLQRHLLVLQLGQIRVLRQAALRGGYEHGRGLDLHDHAAAGDLLDGAVERFAALDRRLNLCEVLADVQPLLGQEDGALGVVELRTHHLDRIADMELVGEHDAALGRDLIIRQNAVCFVPRSTLISAGFTASMTPVTLSPVFKVLKDCSRSSSKLHSSLRFSAIRFFTSCIMPGGVEAPAAIAIVLQTEKRCSSSSVSWHASSMCRTVGQTAAASAYSFCVLELCAPPDDQHAVARLREPDDLFLPFFGHFAYCIKNFCVCI